MAGCDKNRVTEGKTPYEQLEQQDTELTVTGEKEKADKAFGRSIEILEEELTRKEEEK